jgi:predicted nucleic acid-binding protein
LSIVVVDASVVLKWFVPEIHSDAAVRLLSSSHHFLSPDLLFVEVGNAIWKKIRRGELTADDGSRLVSDVSAVAVETVPTRDLLIDAHALAVATGTTVYDALYLALAVRLNTELITADDKLRRVVGTHPMTRGHIRLVHNIE